MEIIKPKKPKLPSVKQMIANANKPKNPLDDLVEYTGNAELDAKSEIKAVSEFGKSIQQQRDAIERNNDTEFWVNIVFNSREQKEAVLKTLGLFELGDKWIHGEDFAKVLGVDCPAPDLIPKPPKQDKKLLDLM